MNEFLYPYFTRDFESGARCELNNHPGTNANYDSSEDD
jgi:hypothetical protein